MDSAYAKTYSRGVRLAVTEDSDIYVYFLSLVFDAVQELVSCVNDGDDDDEEEAENKNNNNNKSSTSNSNSGMSGSRND